MIYSHQNDVSPEMFRSAQTNPDWIKGKQHIRSADDAAVSIDVDKFIISINIVIDNANL